MSELQNTRIALNLAIEDVCIPVILKRVIEILNEEMIRTSI